MKFILKFLFFFFSFYTGGYKLQLSYWMELESTLIPLILF